MLDFSAYIPANWDRDAVQRAIVAFFAIGPIASLLLLTATWAWGPRIVKALRDTMKGDYAKTDDQLDQELEEMAWSGSSLDDKRAYNDYVDRVGQAHLPFSSWQNRREQAWHKAQKNPAEFGRELKFYDRVLYYKDKHGFKQERKSYRAANRAGAFNQSGYGYYARRRARKRVASLYQGS